MIFSSLLSIRSHPVRVRGLKLDVVAILERQGYVAPRAGAWIETHRTALEIRAECRTPCGCVD